MLFRMKLKLKFIHNESRQHYTLSALDLEVLDLGVCMRLEGSMEHTVDQ